VFIQLHYGNPSFRTDSQAEVNVKQAEVVLLAAQRGSAQEEIDQAEVDVKQAQVVLLAAREKLKATQEKLQSAQGS
jgi:hypothetical protein